MLQSNGGAAPLWTVKGSHGSIATRVATPVIAVDTIYFYTWCSPAAYDDGYSGPQIMVQSCNAQDGSGLTLIRVLDTTVTDPSQVPLDAPALGQTKFPNSQGTNQLGLYIQGLNEFHAVNLSNPGQPHNLDNDYGFTPGHGITFTTGFGCCDGLMWVGASNSSIYAFDQSCAPIHITPIVDQNEPINATPVPYKTQSGDVVVFYTVLRYFALYAFDPVTDNSATVPLGNSWGNSLSGTVDDGVLFVGGTPPVDSYGTQVFGIRVAIWRLLCAISLFNRSSSRTTKRKPTGSLSDSPDDRRRPEIARPQQAVKMWADQPDTIIQVNGQSFTIGPDDESFASVQTGLDGLVSIVSDATEMSATALRVWASSMDAYERIVVYPDREFHARLLKAHADPNGDDPDKINSRRPRRTAEEMMAKRASPGGMGSQHVVLA